MWIASAAILAGLVLMMWSADRLVEAAAATAHHHGLPPLLIGMVIMGFGASAPEMAVAMMAAVQGNPALALGTAWGANIGNIGLIMGLTACLYPVVVQSMVLRKELCVLLAATALAGVLLLDGDLSRLDGLTLLGAFGLLMVWTLTQAGRRTSDVLADETHHELVARAIPRHQALCWLGSGLLVLLISARLLVWGAVSAAQTLGVGELVIGLTMVALGTALPDLMACIAAVRKGEHDMALGHVLGSNLVNALAVVGVTGVIAPTPTDPALLWRDWPMMVGLTTLLLVMAIGWRGRVGRIGRIDGGLLVLAYVAYLVWLLRGLQTTA
jgi:cation:H+ antiporter